MKQIHLFLFSCLLIAFQSAYSTNNPYDLSFKGIGTQHPYWRIIGYNYKTSVDSVTFTNRSPFCISNQTTSLGQIKYRSNHFSLFRLVPVSEQEAIVQCELETKINNYENVWLKMYCLNERENIIRADSILLLNDNEWHKNELHIKVNDLHLLGIEIRGLSDNDTTSDIWLEPFKITINGQDLSKKEYAFTEKLKRTDKNPIDIDLINQESAPFDQFFKGNKIIGLGETIHGTQQMPQMACQIIKSQVLHNHCRLILLERDFSEVASWNLFVNNSLDISADSLILMRPVQQDPAALIDLLNWLKNYNQKNQDKVNIVGIDKGRIITEKYFTANYLDFLKKVPNAMLDTLTMGIRFGQFSNAIEYINKNQKSIEGAIGEKECKILQHALIAPEDNKDTLKDWNKIVQYFYNRDRVMWENMQFAIENYIKNDSQNITIYAHISHLNKLYTDEFLFKRSLGYYISKKYNADYHVCTFLAGEGQFTNTSLTDGVISEENKLDEPLAGSLEYMGMKNDIACFYAQVPDDHQILSCRFIGNCNINMWSYGDMKRRMDSYIFIRNNSGLKIPSQWPRETRQAGGNFGKDNWAKIRKIWK
jgi:erythromycin esterase-like protein